MCKFNVVFQSSMPIYASIPETISSSTPFGTVFLVEAIQGANNDFMDFNFQDPLLKLPDNQLGIGQEAWTYHSSEEDSLDPNVQRLFYNGVR